MAEVGQDVAAKVAKPASVIEEAYSKVLHEVQVLEARLQNVMVPGDSSVAKEPADPIKDSPLVVALGLVERKLKKITERLQV